MSRTWLLLAGVMLMLCFLGEARSQPATEIQLPFEKFVLQNGLRVIVHEDRKAPIVAVSVWYHVGSRDEAPGRTGFAHLFEHIMFEGSENYNERFDRPLEQVGVTDQNGTTWFDRTNYFETIPTPATELALFLESDRMGHLLGVLTQEKLDQEREVVQKEKSQGDNEPYGTTFYRILEGLFPQGHPYRHETIGSMDDLNAAGLEDVSTWFNEYYGAANTVLVLAGDISPAQGKALAEKYFGDIQPGPAMNKMKSWVPDRTENTFEVMYDHVPQARSYRVWAVPARTTRERVLLELAAYVLGDGKNSRLYQALIHQTQHAVDLSVEIEPLELSSLFTIDTLLNTGASMDDVNGIIDFEMARFIANGPGEQELKRARTKINAAVIRGLEEVGGFSGKAAILAEGELYDGNPDFILTVLDWINHASAEDVRKAAAAWLSDGRYQLDVYPAPDFSAARTSLDRSKGLPQVIGLPDIIFPGIERTRLSNGLPVALARRDAVPIVSVAIQFDAGYAADADRLLGTSSFTLGMLDESTTSRSALEIDAAAELLGAGLNSGSNLDMSTAFLSALKANLAPSIELFADVVRNPAFASEEMERMRIRRIASVEQEKTQAIGIALRTLPPLIYGSGHAYGIPFTGSGTEESNRVITRDDLVRFQQDWLRPDNASLFVVGDTSMAEVLPMLEAAFGDWKAPGTPIPEKKLGHVDLPPNPRLLLVDKPGAAQSLILAAHVAPPSSAPNTIDIETMNDIIGGTYSARVNQNLRVAKRWSYGAYTVIPEARGQRPWLVYAPVESEHTADAVLELIAEFDRFLSTEPAVADELVRTVNSNSFSLPGQYETNSAVMGALLSNDRFGRPDDYVANLKAQYESIRLEAVQEAAQEVLHPGQLTWVIVGDNKKIRASLEELDLPPVEMMGTDGELE